MRVFLPLLCFLCVARVHGVFDGTCPRKDPPSGMLVLSPGSKLVLTCGGHVKVDGAKVRNSSNTTRRGSSTDATPTTANIMSNTGASMKSGTHTMENAVSKGHHSNLSEAGGNRSLRHTDTASPTARVVQPTSVHGLLKAEKEDGEADYEDEGEEGEGGSRVTRGINSRPRWKWNERTVGKGDRDWGEFTFERGGAVLSLSSVRVTDSGKYTCHDRGRERFSIKVIVADPPENPGLSCYKKSPSSKIRCEWTPQKPITILPKCYLFLSKSPKEPFLRLQCSYSSRASRCWCALNHNEDELRTVHMAYLCVTSIAGNATSPLMHFTPLRILKPDPPSNVSVKAVEGLETQMKVTWSRPASWKSQDNYYALIYEIKYSPLKLSPYHEQILEVKNQRHETITDAMPGVEYQIELRTKDEYDGLWSDWSTPVCGSSWTVPVSDWDLSTTMFPVYADIDGSGSGDVVVTDAPTEVVEVSPHILWISGLFALSSVVFAVYIFRHKDRFMPKLQSLSVVTKCGDSSRPTPSAPTLPEGQALVTFGPPRYKEPPPSGVEGGEEENEEEQCVNERIEAMHFNNTSYFFLPQ